jgi:CBS domain-containing protein
MRVQDIMSDPVRTVKGTATVQFAGEMMALHEVGALPVTSDDVLVGIVTDRDIVVRCLAAGLSPTATAVEKIMTRHPLSVTPDAPVEDAARTFTNMRIRRLPVVEDGHAIGMVTSDDIARLWDNEAAIVVMARRVAPRRRGQASVA